jgi:formylglycine-generating enzyme required for sulfatase activity
VIGFQPFQNLRQTWGWNLIPRRVYMKWNNDGYRPPTMAEWSFAYTGGSAASFPWGDRYEDVGEFAWHYWNADSRTHETGKKKPNGYGLYDMAGNVAEFCIDSDRKGGKAKVTAAVNPVKWMSPYEWTARWRATFLRTGFDYDAQSFVRSNPMQGEHDTWGGAEPGWHWPDIGFRVAINPNYPEDALKPSGGEHAAGGKKALPIQSLNLNRKAGE